MHEKFTVNQVALQWCTYIDVIQKIRNNFTRPSAQVLAHFPGIIIMPIEAMAIGCMYSVLTVLLITVHDWEKVKAN